MASKVYFVDMRANVKHNLLDKLEKLWHGAGFDELVQQKDLVAFKVHFGEKGNLAYIRPQFVSRLVEQVKRLGAKPFITDANTLSVGSCSNAIDHTITAIENGWDYAVVGAPMIIADGLTGKDYVNIAIDGKHFKEVKIAGAAVHANSLISVSRFSSDVLTGFGATLKNIGMGLGSRSGKQIICTDVLPTVNVEKCKDCTQCNKWCTGEAIEIIERKANVIKVKSIDGEEYIVTCPKGAINIVWQRKPEAIQEKMAEYTLGVLKDKQGKCGFITFIDRVSPECDYYCDIGILASRDPIAIEQAAIDLVNNAHSLSGLNLDGKGDVQDKFKVLHPDAYYEKALIHGEKIGLGIRKYELIKL